MHKAHVSAKKKNEVERMVDLVKRYKSVGILNIENLPSPQMQKIRKQLSNKAIIKVSKLRLIKLAFERLKGEVKGIEHLLPKLQGMPALLLTNESPFKIYKAIEKSKSNAPIKPGQKAPHDIVITPGPTPFAPGPMIGEFGALGIKTAIEGGKIVIKTEKSVAKEGEIVDAKTAALLAKLGIEPIEICLNIVAILEGGIVFTKDLLAIDEKKCANDITRLSREALELALYICYPSKDTISLLIAKAHREASSLASAKDIITSENIKELLGKAEAQMSILKNKLGL